MYYRPETGDTLQDHSAARLNLNRVMPSSLDDALLADCGVYPVITSAEPITEIDEVAEYVVEEINGLWTQVWTVRPCTAEELAQRGTDLVARKVEKNAQINRWREAANNTTFTYLDKEVRCDELSKTDLIGTAISITLTGQFPPDFPGGWKAEDNSFIPLPTVEDFAPLYQAFAQRGSLNFRRSQELKVQLAEASTADEVDALTW